MNHMSFKPLPLVMDTQQVAKLFQCPVSTIERYVHVHELVAIQIGKERRFRADDVMDFIAARPSTVKK